MQRTLRIGLADNADVRATVRLFRDACAAMSTVAFNAGSPLSAVELQREVYARTKALGLSAQLACSAIRRVSGAYAAAKSNRKPATRPFTFQRASALWLINGQRGRDASIREPRVLSIWTHAGRVKVPFTVPEAHRADYEAATEVDALQITEKRGKLVATLVVTLPDPPVTAGAPVGIDLNETNAMVAVDSEDRMFFVSGRETRVRNKRTRKTTKRLQKKLATLKAQKRPTRSVVRLLKRLGRKRSLRTRDLARCCAARVSAWAPPGAALVLEDLKLPPPSWAKRPGWSERARAVRRRLSEFPYALYRDAICLRAERDGREVVFVDPRYTSKTCSKCGARGTRVRHRFSCASCGHTDHADRNAARNIRDLCRAARRGGAPSAAPEASMEEASPRIHAGVS